MPPGPGPGGRPLDGFVALAGPGTLQVRGRPGGVTPAVEVPGPGRSLPVASLRMAERGAASLARTIRPGLPTSATLTGGSPAGQLNNRTTVTGTELEIDSEIGRRELESDRRCRGRARPGESLV